MWLACDVQEMIIYAVFTLFFLGAAINSVVVAAHFNHYYYGFYYNHDSLYPAAIVTAVTNIRFLSNRFRWNSSFCPKAFLHADAQGS